MPGEKLTFEVDSDKVIQLFETVSAHTTILTTISDTLSEMKDIERKHILMIEEQSRIAKQAQSAVNGVAALKEEQIRVAAMALEALQRITEVEKELPTFRLVKTVVFRLIGVILFAVCGALVALVLV